MDQNKKLDIKKLISLTILHVDAIEKIIAARVYQVVELSSKVIPIYDVIDHIFQRMAASDIFEETIKKYDEKFTHQEIKELVKICSSQTYKKFQQQTELNNDIFKILFEMVDQELHALANK